MLQSTSLLLSFAVAFAVAGWVPPSFCGGIACPQYTVLVRVAFSSLCVETRRSSSHASTVSKIETETRGFSLFATGSPPPSVELIG
jgi:hypothetical protein